jgi:uncharacterized protein (TIGR03089 family)
MSNIWSLLSRRHNPAFPLVTYVDAHDGSRTELSGISVANAAAKIANALVMEFDAEPGTRIALALPWHWQRATWLGGIWASGCTAVVDEDQFTSSDLVVTDERSCSRILQLGCSDVLAVSLHPFGLPITGELPDGSRDVTIDVRNQPDALLVGGQFTDAAALTIDGKTLSQGQVLDAAEDLATLWSIAHGSRVLVAAADLNPRSEWIAPLALPLRIDGSVLMTEVFSAELAAGEGVTARSQPPQ